MIHSSKKIGVRKRVMQHQETFNGLNDAGKR